MNGADFENRHPEQSNPKFRRVFGIDSHQVRKSDVFPELTPIKSEIPTCFRNWLRSSPKVRGVSGLVEEFSASGNWALATLGCTWVIRGLIGVSPVACRLHAGTPCLDWCGPCCVYAARGWSVAWVMWTPCVYAARGWSLRWLVWTRKHVALAGHV